MIQFDKSMLVDLPDKEDELNDVYKSVLDKDPVQISKILTTAHKLNVHPIAVQNDLKTAEEVAKMPANEYWDYLSKHRPITYHYLTDPVNMATAKDIIPEQAEREGFIQQIKHGYHLNALQVRQSQAGWEQLWGTLTGKKPLVDEAALEQIESEMDELSRTAPQGFAPAYFVANQIPNLLFGAKKAVERGGQAAIPVGVATLIAGNAGPQALIPEETVTLPITMGTAFAAGGKVGYAEATAILEAGSAYREFIKLKDKNGRPIGKKTAAYHALAVGAINAGLEMATLNMFLRAIPGGKKVIDLLGVKQIKDLVKKKTTKQALKTAVGTYLKAGLSETGTEMAQEVTNVAAQALLEDKLNLQTAGEQIGGVVNPTLQATLLNPLIILGLGTNTMEGLQKVKRAQSDLEIYRNIRESATQSELLKRVPSQYQVLLEQQTAGTPLENIFVDAGQFVTLMQSMNPEVGNAAQIVANDLGFGDQLQEALDTGGKIKIPLAEWVEKTVGTEFYQKIEPHVSFSEDGLTLYQAQQEEQRIGQEIKEQQQQALEYLERHEELQEGYNAVYGDVRQKLQAAGKPNDIKSRDWNNYVDKTAKLWAAHAVAEAARRGITVDEWYRQANRPNVIKVDILPSQVPETIKSKLTEAERVFLESLNDKGQTIEEILNDAEGEYNQILDEHIQYLKDSGGKGVQQGQLIRDEDGNVVDRIGRLSNNPLWYRNFYAEHGRAPRKGEYKDLAAEMLRRGYDDEDAQIPADERFVQLENTLRAVRGLKDKIVAGMAEGEGNGWQFNQPVNLGVDPDTQVRVVNLDGIFKTSKNETERDLFEFVKSLADQPLTTADQKAIVYILKSHDVARHVAGGAIHPGNIIKPVRNAAIHSLVDLIQNAVLIESVDNTKIKEITLDMSNSQKRKQRHKNKVIKYHYIYVPVSVKGNIYTVKLFAEQFTDLDNPIDVYLYDLKVDEKSKNRLTSASKSGNGSLLATESGSTISIRQMLEGVKDINGKLYFDDKTEFDTPEIIQAREEQAAQQSTHLINTPERQALRQVIADELYGSGAAKKERKAFIIMGLPASGKSTISNPIAAEHGALVVDADMAKELLPEFAGGKFAGAVHQESSDITDLILDKALDNNDNMILPVIGKNLDKMRRLIALLNQEGFEVNLRLMDISPESAAKRGISRWKETGRFVDPNYIVNEVGLKPQQNFAILKSEGGLNSYEHYNNDVPKGERPRLIEAWDATNGRRDLGGRSDQDLGEASQKEKPNTEGINPDQDKNGSGFLFQEDQTDPRGFVRISPEKSIIGLLSKADASTFLHESAHIFIHDVFFFVRSGQADEAYLQDWGTLKDWLKIADDQAALTTDQQEQFARGFELYLREGKAPSEGLRKAFASFRRWLVKIYQDIRGLDVEISDPVRGVLDRMLATEEEIREREAHNNYLTDLIKESDVSPQTWKRLKELKERAHEMAVQQLLKPQMEELSPEHTEFLAQERERMQKIIEAEVAKNPLHMAINTLGVVFGRSKNINDLAKRYLENKGFTDEGIARFEAVAEAYNFSSGDELAKRILTAPSFVEEVNEQLETHMAQFGDLRDSVEFKYEAEKAVRSEEQIDVLALEREILLDLIQQSEEQVEAVNAKRNFALQRARIAAQAAKKYAHAILATKPYRQAMAATSYFAAERQAAVAEAGCYNKQDYTSAAHFAEQRILNHALALEALRTKAEVEKILKHFAKYQKKTQPKMNQEQLNQVQKILDRFGLVEASVNAKEDATTLNEWIESRKLYADAAIPPSIANEAFRKDYRELTLGQLRDLLTAVKNIETVDRNERFLITDDKRREIDAIVTEITETIYSENKVINPRNFDPDESGIAKARQFLRGFVADHQKVEWIVRALDGYKDQGPVWRYVVLPMMRAMDKEFALRREAGKKYEELIRKYLGKDLSKLATKKIYFAEWQDIFPKGLTKEQILAMALNWGNDGNRERLLDSYADTIELTPEEVTEIIRAYREAARGTRADELSNGEIIRQHKRDIIRLKIEPTFNQEMSYNDWQFVQGVWDLINSYWPQMAEVERLRKGVEPKKVESVPIYTRHGVFAGGYYPIEYDPRLSEQASRYNEQENLKGLTEISYLNPSTKTGMTKERAVGVANRPLNLHLSVIDKHLADVVHLISYINALRDVDKVLNDKRVMTAIKETQGDEVYKQFRPWLMAIGYEYRNPVAPLEKIFSRARMGSSVVNMGFKMTTAFSQLAGIVPVIEKLGPYRAIGGMFEFYGKMVAGKGKEEIDWVFAKSEMMKNRLENRDRDIKDATKKMIHTNKYDSIKDSYFSLIGLFDLAVTVPSWIQAYNKSIEEQAKVGAVDEEMAVRYADGVIRETQGSGDVVNMAAIQRGSELQKLLTQFYSYFSVYANRQIEAVQRARRRGEYGQMLSFAVYWWFFPALLGELLAGRGADSGEPEDLIKWLSSTILKYPASAFVFVRDVVNAFGSKYGGYEVTPSAEAVQKGVELYNSLVAKPLEGKGIDWGKTGKNTFEFGGYWAQYPAKQIETTVGNIYDAMTGESDFELRDLVFPRQQSRR
jgi:hypothetical protein